MLLKDIGEKAFVRLLLDTLSTPSYTKGGGETMLLLLILD